MNTKTCVICTQEFEPSCNRQKYCTECAKEQRKEQLNKAREKYLIKKYSNV